MASFNYRSLLALLAFSAVGAIAQLGARQEGVDCSDLCPTIQNLMSRVQAIEDAAAAKAKSNDALHCVELCSATYNRCAFNCNSVSSFSNIK